MKQRNHQQCADTNRAKKALLNSLVMLKNPAECEQLLNDLCTPAEIEAFIDRFRVLLLLEQGLSYRDISERTGISVTTVGRVERFRSHGNGGYRLALTKLKRLK